MYALYFVAFVALFVFSEYLSTHTYSNQKRKLLGYTVSAMSFLGSMIFAVKHIFGSGLIYHLTR